MSSTSAAPEPEDLAALRAELAASIDELVTRVNPKNVAGNAANQVKTATVDAAAFLTGSGLPAPEESNRSRNAKIALGIAAGLISVLALSLLSRRKK